jgi:hypothetical protein
MNLSIYLINETLCHDIWGSGGSAPPFLTLAVNGSELSASHPRCLTMENNPWYPLSAFRIQEDFI